MKRIVCIFLSIFLCLSNIQGHAAQMPYQPLTQPLSAQTGKEIITPEWLLSHSAPSLDEPMLTWLNKNTIIYAFPVQDNNKEGHIETINIINHKRQFLTDGLTPIPSPNGEWIAYTKGKNKNLQLWVIRSNGTDAKQISHVEGGLGYNDFTFNIAWSNDSKKIILSHQKVVEYWQHQKQSQSKIDVIDITSGLSKEIASIDGGIRYLSVKNNKIFFVKERVGILYNEEKDSESILSMDISGKNLQTIAHFDGLQQFLTPSASPDGKQIAFTYDPDVPFFSIIGSIGLIDISTSTQNKKLIKRITKEIKFWSPQWSIEKNTLYALRELGAYKQIYSINTLNGQCTQITNAPLNIKNYALSPDGKHLAWIGENAHAKYQINIANNDGTDVKNLIVINPYSNNIALSEVREIEWNTVDYPVPIRGLLILPLNYQQGKKYPLIVDIHGGGVGARLSLRGALLTSSPLEWQMWAAKGYAVFVPELRSAGSFGSLAIMRDALQNFDIVNCDIKDVNAGVDYLINQGIADANRLVVIGHSAGSERANWLTVTTHRYKAVISHDGWADNLIETRNQPPSKRVYLFFGGTQDDVPENYQKNSSLKYSTGATTPTLFFAGNIKLGGIGGSENGKGSLPMLYHALKKQGVETDYIYYPDEGHVFEKLVNQRDILIHAINWIQKYFQE